MIHNSNNKMMEYSFAIDPNDYDPRNFEPFFNDDDDQDKNRDEGFVDCEDDENGDEESLEKVAKCSKNRNIMNGPLYPFAKVQSDLVRVCPHFDFISLNEHSIRDYDIEQLKRFIDCSKLGFVDFSIKTPAKHWSGTAIAVAYHQSLCQPTWNLYRIIQKIKSPKRLEAEEKHYEKCERWFEQILDCRLNQSAVTYKQSKEFAMIFVNPKRHMAITSTQKVSCCNKKTTPICEPDTESKIESDDKNDKDLKQTIG